MSTEERSVNQPEEQPSLSEQRLIRRAKLKELQDAGQDPFQITKFVVKHHSADIKEGFEALEGAMTSVAGRIMSKRGMGKAVLLRSAGRQGPHPALRPHGRAGRGGLRQVQKDRHRRHRGRGRRGVPAPSGARCPSRPTR